MWRAGPDTRPDLTPYTKRLYDAANYVYERAPDGPTVAGLGIRAGLAAAAGAQAFGRFQQLDRGVFRDASWSKKLPYLALPALAATGHGRQAIGHARSIWRKVSRKPDPPAQPPSRASSGRSRTWIHSRRVSRRPLKYSRVTRSRGRLLGRKYVRRRF